MRYLQRFFVSLALILLLGTPYAGLVSAQGSSNIQFFINSVDSSAFPDISLKVRAVDQSGNSLTNLSPSQIGIFEDKSAVNPDSVNILTAEKGPVAVIYLIDMGKYSRNALSSTRLKVLLNYYLTEYFRDGIDSVAIYSRSDGGENIDKNITILRPTHSQAELKSAIDRIQMARSNVSSSVLSGAVAVTDDMTVFLGGQAGRASTALIVVSAYNEGNLPDVSVAGNDLRAKNITGNVIYTYENTTRLDPFKQFADVTNGQVVRVPSSGETSPANTTTLYDQIYSRNQLINLKYRSSYGQSGNRNVSIVNSNETVERAADRFTYQVNLNDPQIALKGSPTADLKIGNPLNLTIELSPWSDSINRQLVKAELFIDNKLEATLPAADSAAALTSPITFNVATDKFAAGNHTIDITVTDELGLKGSISPLSLTFKKARVELPTSAPEPTAVPTVNCGANPFASGCVGVLTYVIPIVLVALVGMLAFFMIRISRRMSQVKQKGGPAASEGYDEMKTAVYGRMATGPKGDKPLARMHILVAGKSLANETINIYSQTTSFGRNPEKCDHQLYDISERSTVSGLHCTISYDYGKFLLTDDNSQNGTFIGGKRITPNEPYELKDGDEIILGAPSSNGAKMRFEIVQQAEDSAQGEDLEEADPDHTIIGVRLQNMPELKSEPNETDNSQNLENYQDDSPKNVQKKKSKSDDGWLNEL